jgi:segregation and condensation protein B
MNNEEKKIDPVRNREGSQRPSISNGIEAILFWKGEPMSRKKLAEILKAGELEINQAIENLKTSLRERGIILQEKGGEVALGTAPEFSDLIEELHKEELNKDLSRASLETLSIILYRGGASRPEIDWIRGVNSSFILRALSVRGLVEKIPDPRDSRRLLYRPSFELLSYLGVKSVEELPEWQDLNQTIQKTALEETTNNEPGERSEA